MINVVVTLRVNAGMEKAFEAIARKITSNTLSQDKGCLRYEWYRADAPQTYILIERWTDQAAVQAHLNADHLAALKNSGLRIRQVFSHATHAGRIAEVSHKKDGSVPGSRHAHSATVQSFGELI